MKLKLLAAVALSLMTVSAQADWEVVHGGIVCSDDADLGNSEGEGAKLNALLFGNPREVAIRLKIGDRIEHRKVLPPFRIVGTTSMGGGYRYLCTTIEHVD